MRALCLRGITCWRQNTGGFYDKTGRFVRFGRVGAADITGLLRSGVRIEVECKVGKNKQSPEQVEYQRMIEQNNGIYLLVVDSPQHLIDQLEERGI